VRATYISGFKKTLKRSAEQFRIINIKNFNTVALNLHAHEKRRKDEAKYYWL